MDKRPISRREFLMVLAGLAAVGGTSLTGRVKKMLGLEPPLNLPPDQLDAIPTRSNPLSTPTPPSTRVPPPTATFTPTRTSTATPTPVTPAPLGARVVHVHNPAVSNWTGTGYYWASVNQTEMDKTVNRGLLELTGASDVASAWRMLLPNYKAGQAIAIKVNFNNQFVENGCSQNDSEIDAIADPINSLAAGMHQIGVAYNDIWVFDAIRSIPDRFASRLLPGIRMMDVGKSYGSCRETAGWGVTYIQFHPPSGSIAPQQLTNAIDAAHYLINMPILKKHCCAGISLGFKNHFGSILAPGELHKYVFPYETGFRTSYNPLVDIYLNPHIRDKTILTVGDGTFGALSGQNGPPVKWDTFGNQYPKSLFFSADPVAIDSVMADFLIAEGLAIGSSISAAATSYLPLAHTAGLGVYEHQNPWAYNAYKKIDYRLVEL